MEYSFLKITKQNKSDEWLTPASQMTEENIVAFLEEISRVLQPSGHLFLWVDKFHLCQGDIPWWGQNTDLNLVDMLVWDKGRIGMGYRSRHKSEYCIVLQKSPVRAKGCWNDHTIPDVWQEKVTGGHPHAKPMGLEKALISAVTETGDYVLDPCAGGYTVLEACRQTGRNFIGGDIIYGDTEGEECHAG